MSVQPLFKKPKDVRYVDMAIAIDNEFYSDSCDYDKMYTYMYLLSYMLACKKRYFSEIRDYEEFSAYFALSVFNRMTNPNKPRLKSVLNYMKSVMYFRKTEYECQRHHEVINQDFNPEFDSYEYIEGMRTQLERHNADLILKGIEDLAKDIPGAIRRAVPMVFRHDKAMCHNIYKSCLLSLVNRFTLLSTDEEKLQARLANPSFNEVDYYLRHMQKDDYIILWHLEPEMKNVIGVIMNKLDRWIIDEIRSMSSKVKINDDELNWIMASSFGIGGKNIAADYSRCE